MILLILSMTFFQKSDRNSNVWYSRKSILNIGASYRYLSWARILSVITISRSRVIIQKWANRWIWHLEKLDRNSHDWLSKKSNMRVNISDSRCDFSKTLRVILRMRYQLMVKKDVLDEFNSLQNSDHNSDDCSLRKSYLNVNSSKYP